MPYAQVVAAVSAAMYDTITRVAADRGVPKATVIRDWLNTATATLGVDVVEDTGVGARPGTYGKPAVSTPAPAAAARPVEARPRPTRVY